MGNLAEYGRDFLKELSNLIHTTIIITYFNITQRSVWGKLTSAKYLRLTWPSKSCRVIKQLYTLNSLHTMRCIYFGNPLFIVQVKGAGKFPNRTWPDTITTYAGIIYYIIINNTILIIIIFVTCIENILLGENTLHHNNRQ